MSELKSHKDLDVWQLAMKLAADCYEATRAFPKEEMFGQTSQMRRASVSIAANIAEGYGRESTQSFIQFLRVAQGSQKELETHVMISETVGLLARDVSASLLIDIERVGRMLRNLIRSHEARR